jgi:hypothetical protein
MLQELAHEAVHGDVLRESRHARTQAAQRTHFQANFDTRGARLVERVNHRGIGEAVHLERDLAVLSQVALTVDQFHHAGSCHGRRDNDLGVVAVVRKSREEVKQFANVVGDVRVAREQAKILVVAGRLGVVVSGRYMGVAGGRITLAAHHQGGLGVGLKAHDAVDHVHAGIFQGLGPLNVGRLVKTGLQFHQGHDLLAALGRADKRAHHRRVSRTFDTASA